MSKSQWLTIIACMGLFFVLFFMCETRSPEQISSEKSRALNFEVISPEKLIDSCKQSLQPDASAFIESLEFELKNTHEDIEKRSILEKLASVWYSSGSPSVSGIYAQEIAKRDDDEQSWSIAATTYALCVKRSGNPTERTFCKQRSVKAFENAISINPENLDHKLNLALVHVDAPPADNPMKGISMLLDMNQRFPESTAVLLQLARLGIQTGQYDKATQRLSKVLELEPDNRDAHCYLHQVYDKLGNQALAEKHYNACNL